VHSLVELFQRGLSIREISRRTGQVFQTVRGRLIRAGVHAVKHKRVLNGMATCNRCRQRKPVEEFPALLGGKYQCRSCLNEANHVQQLRRLSCGQSLFQALLQAQGGKCAICGATHGHRSCRGRLCRLAVDHDHRTGKVRGLLCNSCNRGLGRFQDSVENLEAAVRYLKREQ
jgi:hypothetical protein